MKKCPDQERLSLYIDGELSDSELAEVRCHVEQCKTCQAELNNILAEESLLREGLNESFVLHSNAVKIMAKVCSEPAPLARPAVAAKNLFWEKTAFISFAMVLLAMFVWTVVMPDKKFNGTVMAVSCQALNANSTVNGHPLPLRQVFNLTRATTAIDGHFLFNVKTQDHAKFATKGHGKVKLNEKFQPVFCEAEIELTLVSEKDFQVTVNGKDIKLNKKLSNGKIAVTLPETLATASICIPASVSLDIKGIVDIVAPEESLIASSPPAVGDASPVVAPVEPVQQPVEMDDFNKNPFSEEPLGIHLKYNE